MISIKHNIIELVKEGSLDSLKKTLQSILNEKILDMFKENKIIYSKMNYEELLDIKAFINILLKEDKI